MQHPPKANRWVLLFDQGGDALFPRWRLPSAQKYQPALNSQVTRWIRLPIAPSQRTESIKNNEWPFHILTFQPVRPPLLSVRLQNYQQASRLGASPLIFWRVSKELHPHPLCFGQLFFILRWEGDRVPINNHSTIVINNKDGRLLCKKGELFVLQLLPNQTDFVLGFAECRKRLQGWVVHVQTMPAAQFQREFGCSATWSKSQSI